MGSQGTSYPRSRGGAAHCSPFLTASDGRFIISQAKLSLPWGSVSSLLPKSSSRQFKSIASCLVSCARGEDLFSLLLWLCGWRLAHLLSERNLCCWDGTTSFMHMLIQLVRKCLHCVVRQGRAVASKQPGCRDC